MKALKLPPFNDEEDDLDAYLTRFERVCIAFEIRTEHWSTQLARLRQGRSLEVYQRLAASKRDDYGVQNRVPTLLLTKNPGLSRTPMKNFPDLFGAREC